MVVELVGNWTYGGFELEKPRKKRTEKKRRKKEKRTEAATCRSCSSA
jgi:hypothetical protein